ncbi:uncharacterized protein LOC129222927 [Uloborus diversus]|uniref:uncharacterized protein LOC129222927 n=1 Tax=Uloborus diversus TaxID=327109 RepID=UPI0024099FB7|nr:uncharacterized protein LOC129222927 [Uloborus diversus]
MHQKLLSLGLLVLFLLISVTSHLVRFKYFDEYLLHLEKREQTIIIEEVEIKVAGPLLLRTGKLHLKEEQCCMLGQMAGKKGFHCISKFYAPRMIFRNYNRAHNKKIAALLKGKADPTADKLMRTFGQCVIKRGTIFDKCCRFEALKD